jgi:hypothetical protein
MTEQRLLPSPVAAVVPPAASAGIMRTPKWAVAALCATSSVALGTGIDGAIAAWLLGVSMLIVPGVFVADIVAPRGPTERLVLTLSVSLVTWMIIGHIMLSLQWWQPRLVSAVILGLAALCSALWTKGRTTAQNIAQPRTAWADDVSWPRLIWSAVALALWAGSLPFVDTNFDDWGLITAVPPTFLVAWVIAVGVAAAAATARRSSPRGLAVGIAPLLLIIYGTLPLLIDTIRYPWAYKHVGVIRLLDETGRFHPDVDIYNNFSGFFGLGALLRGATSIDPTSYAPWTQLAAEAAILTAVWLLVRRATLSERVAHLATVLYLVTNWVGQNYFAPQTIATYLCLAFLALVIGWFMDGEVRQPRLAPRWLRGRLQALPVDKSDKSPALHHGARLATVLALYLGLLMAHPLTPVLAVGAVGLAWVVGWVRDRGLLIGMGLLSIGWGLRCIPYFAAQSFDLGFGGQPSANAAGNLDMTGAPATAVAVGELTRGFSLVVWLAALVGALVCSWAMRRTGLLMVLVLVPFGLPFVQSYGGEVIYRVYLYSLPMVVAFAAWGLLAAAPATGLRRWPQTTILATAGCLLMSAGFLVAHYGRENINTVDQSEVAMGEYIAENISDPALLAQFDGTYPAASSARYSSFQVNDTYTPYVVEMLGRSTVLPSTDALNDVADDLVALDAGTPYVIVSPGMLDSIRQVNSFPVHSTADAVEFLVGNQRFIVRHQIDDTWLVQVLS